MTVGQKHVQGVRSDETASARQQNSCHCEVLMDLSVSVLSRVLQVGESELPEIQKCREALYAIKVPLSVG